MHVGIVKHKLCETIQVVGRFTRGYEATLKTLHLLIITREAETAENVYQLPGSILAVYVH